MTRLSAGLGVPSWVILDKNPSWIWQEKGDKTDWYSSVHLFREGKKDYSKSQIVDVLKELALLASK